jgi:hypothetical protein
VLPKSAVPFISSCCEGKRCFCGEPATHKLEEAIALDDPHPRRHPLTSYVCHAHFRQVMGSAADQGSAR